MFYILFYNEFLSYFGLSQKVNSYGKLLDTVNINGINLDVYSNGDSNSAIYNYSYDFKGNKLGIQFQCVELVRRYIYYKYNDNLALKYNKGDAKDWYSNREIMGLYKIDLNNLSPGDIITFRGGKWGHIALVNNVNDQGFYITSQNFFNDDRDINYFVNNDIIGKENFLCDHNENKFIFESFMRYNKKD